MMTILGKAILIFLGLIAVITAPAAGTDMVTGSEPANPCRLVLPDQIQVVVGREVNIYFDNIVLVPNRQDYLFDVKCDKGIQQEERWTFVPTAADKGDWPLTVNVYDSDNRLISSAKTIIHVVPADAGAGREVSFLMIGDSLTHFAIYPEAILNLCKVPGNPHLTLIGTHHVDGTSPENLHEGYGGWTFERFAAYYSTNRNMDQYQSMCSPFVFLENGKPTLDFKRYISENAGGKSPDFVSIFLGANDIFAATDDNIESAIDNALTYADKLVANIRGVNPDIKIGLVMSVPPAASQDAFGNNYGCGQTRWQYRRNQHRLVERMKEKYRGREKEKLYLIPAFINIDAAHNYPSEEVTANSQSQVKVIRQSNALHPAAPGYGQIADIIYGWMKGLL